jgi:alkaline phosphatase D
VSLGCELRVCHTLLLALAASIGCDGGSPRLMAGPILGAVTNESVKVWIRSDRDTPWSVSVWPRDEPAQVRRFAGPLLQSSTYDVGVVELTGLAPSTEYAYRVELGLPYPEAAVAADSALSFHTLTRDGASGHLRFTVGADIDHDSDQPIFTRIATEAPDFAMLIGDQIYADRVEPDLEGYTGEYTAAWNIAQLRELMSRVPMMMMWDDHEIRDNYAGQGDRIVPARAAYELFVHAHNPDPIRADELYYSFEAGDVSLFVLDVRSHRSRDRAPDDDDKTMLGKRQREDLLHWLSHAPGRIKVVVSPVTFSNFATTGDDAWKSFGREREEIFSYIDEHRIDDVLLIAGDQHWSGVFEYDRPAYRLFEFEPTPLSKARALSSTAESSEILARDDDHFVFGVVDIDTRDEPASIDLTLCAADRPCDPGAEPEPGTSLEVMGLADNVPFTVHLTTDEIGTK